MSSVIHPQDLIDEIWYEIVVKDESTGAQFVSHKRLKDSLNSSRIEALLKCACVACGEHRAEAPKVDESRLRLWISASAQRLFALLSEVGCAQLIRGFCARGYGDTRIEAETRRLSISPITCGYWPVKCQYRRLAERVEETRHRFFVPILNDKAVKSQDIQVFDAKTILPFTKQEKIGRGAFGNVYAVELLEEYRDFKGIDHRVQLVRKEIEGEDIFPDELPILLQVRGLNSEHIVRLVTAYKHGSKLNLVFPRATTTLFQLFREEKPVVAGLSYFCIEQHPIWEQMLAVIESLYQLYAESYHASSGKQIKLYHFDLKPANILVDKVLDGLVLRVTDFGLSRAQHVVNRAGLSSRVSGCPGTAAYAPPEMEISDGRWNHRYDVWSLGCIMLEACAYVVGGAEGIRAFEAVKFTPRPTQQAIRDENLWQMSLTGKLEIKPTVLQWIRRLPRTTSAGDKTSIRFLTEVLELAVQMLDVDPTTRLDAEAAYNRLEAILRNASRPESSGSSYDEVQSEYSSSSTGSAHLAGSVPVGLNELDECQPVNCRHFKEQYQGACARLYEDDKSVLRLELRVNSTKTSVVELGPRRSLSLIPSPVLGHQNQNRIVVHLAHVQDGRADSVRINLTAPQDTAILQSVLMSQAVRSISNARQKSLDVRELQIEQFSGTLRPRLMSKNKSRNLSHLHGAPTALQFWTEKNYVDPAAWASIRPRRGSPRFLFDVPVRRLVLYCDKALVTIRFGRNVRLKKMADTDSGWYHQLVPTDDSRLSNDQSFAVSVLTTAYKGYVTAPLDKEELLALEESATYECSLVQLGFNSKEDWSAFRRRYQTLKEDWKREYDEIQKLKESGAAERGWAPNSTAI